MGQSNSSSVDFRVASMPPPPSSSSSLHRDALEMIITKYAWNGLVTVGIAARVCKEWREVTLRDTVWIYHGKLLGLLHGMDRASVITAWSMFNVPYATEDFMYQQLEKRGVLIDSEVPVFVRRKFRFRFSCDGRGRVIVEAMIAGIVVETMSIDRQALQMKRQQDGILCYDQVTFGSDAIVHLLLELAAKHRKKLSKMRKGRQ